MNRMRGLRVATVGSLQRFLACVLAVTLARRPRTIPWARRAFSALPFILPEARFLDHIGRGYKEGHKGWMNELKVAPENVFRPSLRASTSSSRASIRFSKFLSK